MYDTLAQLFVFSFAGIYIVFFALFVFWILKPRLVPAMKKLILPRRRQIAGRAEAPLSLPFVPIVRPGELKGRSVRQRDLTASVRN
jgi:hypothetical protein